MRRGSSLSLSLVPQADPLQGLINPHLISSPVCLPCFGELCTSKKKGRVCIVGKEMGKDGRQVTILIKARESADQFHVSIYILYIYICTVYVY